MNNDALSRIFSSETIARFERLSEATEYQWKYGFERQLTLFRLMAFILVTVEEQASHIPLEEAGLFLLELVAPRGISFWWRLIASSIAA